MSGADIEEIKNRYHTVISSLDSRFFGDDSCRQILKDHFKVSQLAGLGLGDYETGVVAAGAVMRYLYETQKNTLGHMTTITTYSVGQYMILGYVYQKKFRAFGDLTGEAETRLSAVGLRQNQNRHGRPYA